MAETVYEGMFLLDSNRYGRDPEGVAGQVPGMIREAGGEVLVSRLWEERRLAFPIKGRRKGTYWLTYFRMDGRNLGELKRKSQLNENVLRMLFVKIDPRIVDTLVEHAQEPEGKPAGEPTEEKKPGPAEEKKAQPAEEKKAQPAEEKKAQPAEEKKTEPAKQTGVVAKAEGSDPPASENKAD